MRRLLAIWLFTALAASLLSVAYAGGPVMPRQGPKGTVIVVSDLERADYEDFIAKMRPKYALWVGLDTPKDEIEMPPAGLAMVVFLLRSGSEAVNIHSSWYSDLPVPPKDLVHSDIMIASKTVHPPGKPKPKWYATMVLMAPDHRLLDSTLKEAVGLRDFPLRKPIMHEVVDLRDIRGIACLPTVGDGAFGAVASAGEAALYRGFVDLRAFTIVGREAISVLAAPTILTDRQVRELGSDLDVQALAFLDIQRAESEMEEEVRYVKSRKTAVSEDARRDFERRKERARAQGKPFKYEEPKDDLVWAAPYRTRTYTTTVAASIKLVDAQTGGTILIYDVEDAVSSQDKDDVRSYDYRWYHKSDIDYGRRSRTETYSRPLNAGEAGEIARAGIEDFFRYLEARAMLPVPGQDVARQPAPPVDAGQTIAKVLAIDGENVYINYGAEDLARVGDTLSLWADKSLEDPDSGEVIEVIKARVIQIEIVETYQKTSRCVIVEQSDEFLLDVGMELVLD